MASYKYTYELQSVACKVMFYSYTFIQNFILNITCRKNREKERNKDIYIYDRDSNIPLHKKHLLV